MSGFKNIGSIIDIKRGVYDPKESKVNLVVPDVSIIRPLSKNEDVESIKAGILNTVIDKM